MILDIEGNSYESVHGNLECVKCCFHGKTECGCEVTDYLGKVNNARLRSCQAHGIAYWLLTVRRTGPKTVGAENQITSEQEPDGKSQHESGAKLDKRKPDASLLLMFGKALLAVSEVGTFGAEKYTRGGWQGVENGVNRYTAAMLRHVMKEHYGAIDEDSKLMHAGQVAWNALARLELMLRERK